MGRSFCQPASVGLFGYTCSKKEKRERGRERRNCSLFTHRFLLSSSSFFSWVSDTPAAAGATYKTELSTHLFSLFLSLSFSLSLSLSFSLFIYHFLSFFFLVSFINAKLKYQLKEEKIPLKLKILDMTFPVCCFLSLN